LTTHAAADGALARIRVPGGRLRPDQLEVLAGCAADLGDGTLHLTSRANVQLRGLDSDTGELAARLWRAGLLPSPAHELVRNIVASPLSGYLGGRADVRELPAVLDAALCARPELAVLPGRFLFAFDDGRGDVADQGVDLAWLATGPHAGALLLAGLDTGLRIPLDHAATALVQAAAAFVEVRGTAWRIAELDAEALDAVRAASYPQASRLSTDKIHFSVSSVSADRLAVRDAPGSGGGRTSEGRAAVGEAAGANPAPIGVLSCADGTRLVSAGVPLGELSAGTARLLGGLGVPVIVTPWRSVVLPGLGDAKVLAGTELVTDPGAPALGVTACTGLPGCGRSRADVRADAKTELGELPGGIRAHVAGCERRCGRPREEHVDVLAEDGGYRVDAQWVPVERLAATVVRKGTRGAGLHP
jgi:precorrin-3B synthase